MSRQCVLRVFALSVGVICVVVGMIVGILYPTYLLAWVLVLTGAHLTWKATRQLRGRHE